MVIEKFRHEKRMRKKIDKMQINFSRRQLFMSDSKMCRNICPRLQIKNCLSSLYQNLSTAVLATTLFVTKIMCFCITHDATSWTLLNSTNEANTFLMMYNIINFSRLSKLVSRNLNVTRLMACKYNVVTTYKWSKFLWVND